LEINQYPFVSYAVVISASWLLIFFFYFFFTLIFKIEGYIGEAEAVINTPCLNWLFSRNQMAQIKNKNYSFYQKEEKLFFMACSIIPIE
jgi:hypothetical protein